MSPLDSLADLPPTVVVPYDQPEAEDDARVKSQLLAVDPQRQVLFFDRTTFLPVEAAGNEGPHQMPRDFGSAEIGGMKIAIAAAIRLPNGAVAHYAPEAENELGVVKILQSLTPVSGVLQVNTRARSIHNLARTAGLVVQKAVERITNPNNIDGVGLRLQRADLRTPHGLLRFQGSIEPYSLKALRAVLQDAVNGIIYDDLPLNIESVEDEERQRSQHLVRLGNFTPETTHGTHLSRTGKIDSLKINKMERTGASFETMLVDFSARAKAELLGI